MPFTANRRRPIQVKFFVDENELAVIKQRMTEFGTNNFSTYLRTMAMEGIFPTANGKRKQNIHICYDLVGFITMDELLKAEQA